MDSEQVLRTKDKILTQNQLDELWSTIAFHGCNTGEGYKSCNKR
jgi:hypothetical protein